MIHIGRYQMQQLECIKQKSFYVESFSHDSKPEGFIHL